VYLFKGIRLCVFKCGTKELLIRDVYEGALASYYEESKMTSMLKEHHYKSGMTKDVQSILKTCVAYQVAKSHSLA